MSNTLEVLSFSPSDETIAATLPVRVGTIWAVRQPNGEWTHMIYGPIFAGAVRTPSIESLVPGIVSFVLASDGDGEFVFQDSLLSLYGLGANLFDAIDNWVELAQDLLVELQSEPEQLAPPMQALLHSFEEIAGSPQLG